MSINGPGATLDMATSEENVPETMPIKPGDAVQWGAFYDPKSIVFAPDQENAEDQKPDEEIKEIQAYFKNPNNDLKIVLGNDKYNGLIDGKINEELLIIAKKLEKSISELLGQSVNDIVLMTNVNDIKAAVNKIAAYKKYLKKQTNSYKKMSLDERFYKLSQLLCCKKS